MIENNVTDSVSYVPRTSFSRTLDNLSLIGEMCVYCKCGRIVKLDRSEMQLKLALGKELQCTSCRNARISDEIEYLNNLYSGLINEENL